MATLRLASRAVSPCGTFSTVQHESLPLLLLGEADFHVIKRAHETMKLSASRVRSHHLQLDREEGSRDKNILLPFHKQLYLHRVSATPEARACCMQGVIQSHRPNNPTCLICIANIRMETTRALKGWVVEPVCWVLAYFAVKKNQRGRKRWNGTTLEHCAFDTSTP
jgi:hypothetical protein